MHTATSLLQKLKELPESLQDADVLLQDVAPRVCAGEVTVQQVVEALGSSLTHQNPAERAAGTQFLAGLLEALPTNHLSPLEASFMAAFLVDRLRDHHSVLPAVFLASLALVRQEGLEDAGVGSLVEGLFREVQVQSHVMADRRTVFTFLKYCILHRLPALEALPGSGVVLGVVGAVDGERDPRNLLVAFSLVVALVHSGLPLHPFTEDLFEVVAAYFPIDFVPPPNDPYGICSGDLVLGLREALASTPLFAPHCLPLLQEKLDSDLIPAKLDALHTLVACCERYTAEALHPHTLPLWASVRREVVEGADRAVEEAALSALTAVVRVLEVGPAPPAAYTASTSLIQSALAECEGHLATPEQRLMSPSTRLLVALVVAAPGPAATIAKRVVPLLAGQCAAQGRSPSACQNTITALAKVLEAAAKHPHLAEEDGPLSQLAGQVWGAFSQSLSSTSGPQLQAATLAALPPALPALPAPHLQQAAQELTALLLDPTSHTLREGVRMCLERLGQHHPPTILSHTLPSLLAALHSEEGEDQVLETLASLATSKAVLAPVLVEVWGRTEAVLAEGSVDRCCRYLSTVAKIVESNLGDAECRHHLLEEWGGTRRTLALCTSLALLPHPTHTPALRCLASTLRSLVATESDPQPLVSSLVGLATGMDVQGESETEGEAAKLLCQNPDMRRVLAALTDADDPNGPYMLYVMEALLGGARSLPEEDTRLLLLMKKLRAFSGATSDPGLREAAILSHATTLNKLPQGPHLVQAEEEARADMEPELDLTRPGERRQAVLLSLTWTCRALVVRGSDLQQWWTKKLLDLLGDAGLGVAAALSFETIVKEHPYALRPHTHARTRLLYKQRFFEGVVGPLVDTFMSSSSHGPARACCLVALCSLLPHLPRAVLTPHIDKVLPVVLQGVGGEGGDVERQVVVVESVVETLATLLHHSPTPAAPHTSTLLPALLTLTTKQPMKVRVKALECLDALATLPTPILLPYRHDVLQGLKVVLDDHKRVVRRAATTTRGAWVMVGAPAGS